MTQNFARFSYENDGAMKKREKEGKGERT